MLSRQDSSQSHCEYLVSSCCCTAKFTILHITQRYFCSILLEKKVEGECELHRLWLQPCVLCHLDIDQEFKEQLVNLVPTLLSPANLVEKEIGGAKVTCRDLLHYFKVSSCFFLIPASSKHVNIYFCRDSGVDFWKSDISSCSSR